ncbi:MAG: SagB/ThcOx family dehydrogenase [Candidatus Omnitrophica bacterium]|nr:SagB/ThcOx family dehydrogenase [Candidatus Omnitrophota bacterium]
MFFKIICILLILSGFLNLHRLLINAQAMEIKLKPPNFKTENLKNILERRVSCRNFKTKSLSLEIIATVLWATAGKKHDTVTEATRTIPSAGATYPLELYLVVGINGVENLKEGIYHYRIDTHSLEFIQGGDKRSALAAVCLGQSFIEEAPVSLVIAAKFSRTTMRYGKRGERYVYIEAGCASQNTYLAVTTLGLGTVEVGAFSDKSLAETLGLTKDIEPLLVMPIGYAQ